MERLASSDRSRLLNDRVGQLWLLQDRLIGWTGPERRLWLRQGTDWLTTNLPDWWWAARERAIVRDGVVVEVERGDLKFVGLFGFLGLLRWLRRGMVVRERVVKTNGPTGLLTNG